MAANRRFRQYLYQESIALLLPSTIASVILTYPPFFTPALIGVSSGRRKKERRKKERKFHFKIKKRLYFLIVEIQFLEPKYKYMGTCGPKYKYKGTCGPKYKYKGTCGPNIFKNDPYNLPFRRRI